jgi:hypothetical protein
MRKTKNKIEGRLPQGCIRDPRNKRMGKKGLDIEKNEYNFERCQGPEGAVAL